MMSDILELNPLYQANLDEVGLMFLVAMAIGIFYSIVKFKIRMAITSIIAFLIVMHQFHNVWLTIGFGMLMLMTTIRPSHYKHAPWPRTLLAMSIQATTGLFLVSFGTRVMARHSGSFWKSADQILWTANLVMLALTAMLLLVVGFGRVKQQSRKERELSKKVQAFKHS